jgi:hypothetical protein
MGLLKGGLLFFAVSLLFVSLLISAITLTISTSLDQEKLQDEIAQTVAEEFAKSSLDSNNTEFTESIEESFPELERECETNEEVVVEDEEGRPVATIPCEAVEQGAESVVEEVLNSLAKNFTDSAIDEITEEEKSPLRIFHNLFLSENSKDFWKKGFYYSIFFSLILAVAVFFLVEKKTSLPITLGTLLMVASLPIFLASLISSNLESSILRPIAVLFSNAYSIFTIYIVSGFLLIILGVGLKFLEATYSISEKFTFTDNLFNKKEEVKTKKK